MTERQCKRGHLIAGANIKLIKRGADRNYPACRACLDTYWEGKKRGQAFRDLSQAHADRRYEELMGGEGK